MTSEKKKKLEMGGQAVIEGVMMRSPMGYSIAVRKKDNRIKIKTIPYRPLTRRIKFLGLPFIRGVINLFEMLIIGMKGLDYSVNEWEGEEEDTGERIPESAAEETDTEDIGNNDSESEEKRQISYLGMAGLITISLGMAIFLMVILPNLITHFLGKIGEGEFVEAKSPLLFNLVAGFFRGCILILYISVISLSKDIRRIFEYHGAEHKVVFAFEDKKELTLDNVRSYTTRHPRCGTTFLFVVIFISIIIFAFIAKIVGIMFPGFLEMNIVLRKIILMGLHIVFLPVVAGTSYEIIKYGSRHLHNPFTRFLTYPGLLSQYITTKEPDDSQLEVSIASLKAALDITPDQKDASVKVLEPREALNKQMSEL